MFYVLLVVSYLVMVKASLVTDSKSSKVMDRLYLEAASVVVKVCSQQFKETQTVSVVLNSSTNSYHRTFTNNLQKMLHISSKSGRYLTRSSSFDDECAGEKFYGYSDAALVVYHTLLDSSVCLAYAPTVKIILVFVNNSLEPALEKENVLDYSVLFRHLWEKFKIIDVLLVMLHLSYRGTEHQILTYNPFLSGGSVMKNDIALDTYYDVQTLISNMNLYPVRVIVNNFDPEEFCRGEDSDVTFTGRDGTLLLALSRSLNFTPQLVPTSHGPTRSTMANGSLLGPIEDLVADKADVVFSAEELLDFPTGLVQFTSPPSNAGYYLILTPRASLVTAWLAVSRELALLLATCVGFCSVVWNVSHRRPFRDWPRSLTETLRLLFPVPDYTFHRRVRGVWSRGFSSTLLLVGIVLTATLQAFLVSVFNESVHDSEINDLDSLRFSGLAIAVPKYFAFVIPSLGESSDFAPLKNFLYETTAEEAWQNLIVHKNAAVFLTKTSLGIRLRKHPEIANLLNVLPSWSKQYFVAYKVPYGSFLLPKFDRFIGRWAESGFYDRYYRTTRIINSDTFEHKEAGKLNLSHLAPAATILLCGCSLSMLIFLMEIIFILRSKAGRTR